MLEPLEVCDVPIVDAERVRRVQARLTDIVTAGELADIFATLADPTRLRVIEALSHEELCVCDLSAALGLSQSSASHHLRTLRNLRLVRHRRAGRLVYYALDDSHIAALYRLALDHVREDNSGAAPVAAAGAEAQR